MKVTSLILFPERFTSFNFGNRKIIPGISSKRLFDKFKYSKFYELLFSVKDLSSEQQKIAISKFTKNWIGKEEQVDDITVAGVKF
mgnify:CR=1 FL=1